MTAPPPMPDMVLPPPEWDWPLPPAMTHDAVATTRAVPFVSEPGFRAVYLDFHRPANDTTVPLVVFIHGGAFLFGTREILTPMYVGRDVDPYDELVAAGFAVATVDYRLSGEAVFPACLHDVAAAVRFLVHRARDLGIDPDRMAVWGESAGGHLAQLLAFGHDDPARVGGSGAPVPIPRFAALVSWYGLNDLRTPVAKIPFPGPSPEERLLGGPPEELAEAAALASPITQVRNSIATALVLHGTDDTAIPIAQSHHLAELLTEAGVDVETSWLDGADHAWNGNPEAAEEALALTIDYLRRRLKP